ncbi:MULTISPECIES: malonyl-CoA decarboxylase family protein [Brucella]|uniref:malonyl-CoA decarboxylase domain-containing protein n=1 Tax=Brucella/Ochrobactrum group TaxID=2826938 RepID=UPI001FCF11DA|nr:MULTISPECIES: malonyl-CoA decarboxylase family protein [Brucella]MDX4072011.1 malonyl-CoA decarboxylase family protein [Brucella sp. NBRC 113783]
MTETVRAPIDLTQEQPPARPRSAVDYRLAEIRPLFLRAAVYYLLPARTANGRLIDPVARFHLGNGARLERLNYMEMFPPKLCQNPMD